MAKKKTRKTVWRWGQAMKATKSMKAMQAMKANPANDKKAGPANDMKSVALVGALDAGQHVEEPWLWDTHPEYSEQIYDEIIGVHLAPQLVSRARSDEMDFVIGLNAYDYDTVANCKDKTGKLPVPVGWAGVNKGDEQRPAIRSRLVVQETKYHTTMKVKDPAQTFSATPPYECLRF